jgi:hypothetical protein
MTSDPAQTILPLLTCVETLGLVARHLDPSAFGEVMEAIGTPETALQAMRPQFDGNGGPDSVGGLLARASDEALAGFAELREAAGQGDVRLVFKALRHLPRAQEALYPLASMIPVVNAFFLDPSLRSDADALRRAMQPPRENETGVFHVENEPRNARRLLALCAGKLYAGPRMAACGGPAWRQRTRARLSLELVARCAQLRRDPDRPDIVGQFAWFDMGADGRR